MEKQREQPPYEVENEEAILSFYRVNQNAKNAFERRYGKLLENLSQ